MTAPPELGAARTLFADERVPSAVFSCDGGGRDGLGTYRYRLEWPAGGHSGSVLWILANPSTATADKTDPTIAKCIRYATAWGYAWSRTVNVRAWRETNPKLVPADPFAVGPENDAHIVDAARGASIVVCGWGKLGGTRGLDVLRLLERNAIQPYALALNKDGSPQHPLYIRGDAKPIAMASTPNTPGEG